MNIQYVSLTGADDKTSHNDLAQLTEQFPNVEWALLMFPERDGFPRNPTKAWRDTFHAMKFPQTALHLCGSAIERFAEENTNLLNEIELFKRIQINLKPNRATPELVEQLTRVVEKFPQLQFITQYNEVNSDYFKYWNPISNHAYLFDGSLGKGVKPEQWEAPVFNKFCGYAGGLSPDNIEGELVKIAQVTQGHTIWIDMESGIRSNDQFDLQKAKKILEAVSIWKKT